MTRDRRVGLRRRGVRVVAALAIGLGIGRKAPAGNAEDILDQLEQALSFSSRDGELRARLSGTADVETYTFAAPAPWLIQTGGNSLVVPRLTTFVDAQWGPRLYGFAQTRVDRGFDPAQARMQIRLDEYAVRLTPWSDSRLNLQLGKFATVVGNWTPRHGSWANPFITAPLPYESLTGMWDAEAIRSAGVLLQWSHVRPGLPPSVTATEKSLRIPVIWGPSYAIGAAVSGEVRSLQYAFEIKQASLSSRPEAWNDFRDVWRHPTISGRVGFHPNETWNLGVSASVGPYLQPFASATIPARRHFGDYRQSVLGYDLSYAHHHLQIWGEVFGSRFEIPRIGHADLLSAYVETKYRFTPRFSTALRWNQQWFDRIRDRGRLVAWGHDAWRLDLGPAWRFSPHVQLKLQYSLQHGDTGPRDLAHTGATQITVRF